MANNNTYSSYTKHLEYWEIRYTCIKDSLNKKKGICLKKIYSRFYVTKIYCYNEIST